MGPRVCSLVMMYLGRNTDMIQQTESAAKGICPLESETIELPRHIAAKHYNYFIIHNIASTFPHPFPPTRDKAPHLQPLTPASTHTHLPSSSQVQNIEALSTRQVALTKERCMLFHTSFQLTAGA